MRTAAIALSAALAACGSAPQRSEAPETDMRAALWNRRGMEQAERIARLSDAEVAAELVRPAGDRPPPPRAEPGGTRLAALDHWLDLLRCRDRATVAARGACYADAARLHEAAERLVHERAREAVRT